MKTENIHCDVCGYKFSAEEPRAFGPASVELKLQSPPRPHWESERLEHVCWACVEAFRAAFRIVIVSKKLKPLKDSE